MSRALPPALLRALNLGPPLLSALMLVFIGMELARLFWLLMPEGPAWEPPPPSSSSAPAARPEAFDMAPLLAANLYGDYSAQPVTAVATNEIDAPDTKLRLTLRGIVAAESAEESRALIESQGDDLKPYAVGMDIPGGAKLHAVHPDRVLLSRGGRLETLRLERELPTDPDAVVAISEPAPSLGSASTIIGPEAAVKLNEIRSELLNDPTKASRYMRMQPARRDGGLVGYRIYPGRDRELFREVGLRPGDIITSVNGVDLNDPARGLQLLGELSQATNINLTVERAGNLQSFSVSLNP